MKNNGIAKGAFILSVGGVLAKVFSAVYRIGLTRILGGEGIGLYQLVFPLYSLCVILATAGIPMAISKVISKNPSASKAILKKCLMYTCVISLVLGFALLLMSGAIARFQGTDETTICYIILAPTIIIVSVSSVLRGYFQGRGMFTPSALSNIAEQFVKLALGLGASMILLKVSLIAAIIGAFASIAISELVSLAILILYLKKLPNRTQTNTEFNAKEVLKDVYPIILNNLLLPIAAFVDSLIVIKLLTKNFSHEIAVFMYGLQSGAVASLVGLPSIFSFAIASVILPNINLKSHPHNRDSKLAFALKIVLIITLPCVLAFLIMPNRLISILYSNRLDGLGVDGLNIAYRLLTISGLGVVFLAINQIYSSCLQAVDVRITPVVNLSIGVLLKFIIELLFMPSVKVNIYALALGNTVCYLTAFLLNHLQIKLHFNAKIGNRFFAKICVALCAMIGILFVTLNLGNSACNTLISIVLAGCTYLVLLFVLKIFNKKDIASIKYR